MFKLRFPVDAPDKISQPFGVNWTTIADFYTRWGYPGHEGVDFGGKQGDPIYAAADGVINQLYRDDGAHPYGNHVRINHLHAGQTYETVYAHLRGFMPGLALYDRVRAGQQIGLMGNTGNVVKGKGDGTHLHFTLKKQGASARGETRYARDVIDPTPYFGQKG